MSFEEIWISYLAGATLWIAPADCVGDPEQIAAAVARQRISVIHAVPTLMGLVDDPLPTVRLINLAAKPVRRPSCAPRAAGAAAVQYLRTDRGHRLGHAGPLEPDEPGHYRQPLPNYGLMIVDDHGGRCRPGEAANWAFSDRGWRSAIWDSPN